MFNVLPAGRQASATQEKWNIPSFDPPGDAVEPQEVAGYREGFEQGQQEARQLLAAEVDRVQQLLRALTAPSELVSNEIRDELLSTAFAVARLILQREVSQSAEDFKALVDEAIAALPMAPGDVEVALNPDDIALLSGDEPVSSGAGNRIVADAGVARGSCRVKRAQSVVHGGIDGLLQQLAEKHGL